MYPGLVKIDGLWWPDSDKECRKAVMQQYLDADLAIQVCRAHNIAVQAGGNCGVWPIHLSKHFKTVYTFEPDLQNFLCLNLNAPEENIIRMQAALGHKAKQIHMVGTPHNVGAHHVGGKGQIPVIRLDDLRLPACDFLQLDIEGYEYYALRGALHTIDEFKPVIMIEDKGHHVKYGVEKSAIIDLFEALEYVPYNKIHRDLIMIPKEFLKA